MPVEWALNFAQPGFPESNIIPDNYCIARCNSNQVDIDNMKLCHPDTTRRHTQLRVTKQEKSQALDLGSLNGTFLDKTE